MKATCALAAAALVVLVVGPATPAANERGAATASKAAQVKMVSFAFRPGTVNVAKGARVVFKNTSGLPHTATRRGSFDTGRVAPGGAKGVTFSTRGTFGYFCKIHPEMRGRVVVG
jgi:plastocyanin